MKKYMLTGLFLSFAGTLFAQTIPYKICNNCWNADSLGNHRVVVTYNGSGRIAKATIPWRRPDHHPDEKRIIVQDAETGQKVLNIKTGTLNREYGEVYFEPISGKGEYYIYYMPFKNQGSANYPNSVYLKPERTASDNWLQNMQGKLIHNNAAVDVFQAIDSFNSFYPMEVIATQYEMKRLKKNHSSDAFLVYPEDRLHSIRMSNDLPDRWIEKGPGKKLRTTADKGENVSFQLGIYALKNLKNIQVTFSDLRSNKGQIISLKNISCLNTSGTSYDGKPLKLKVDVPKGKVQALWCLIDVPVNAVPGIYSGRARVLADGLTNGKLIDIELIISNKMAKDHGADEPWKMTRLKWLNSTMAQENTVIAPYTALQVSGNTISLLGRKILLDDNGLPKQIQTFFTPEMTGYQSQPNNLLTEAMHFHFTKASDSKDIEMKNEGVKFTLRQPGTVKWTSTNTSDELKMEVEGTLEFDGFVDFKVKVTALKDIDLGNITMHIPFEKQETKYMMGLGQKGGKRPEGFKWKWDVATKSQDGVWLGNVNAGLHYSLRDENYVRPLNTNFYLMKPLLLPTSWGNGTKGGIDIGLKGKSILADNYSGPRSMKKGDVLYYNFNLLITPFHPLNTDFQWATRFYHAYKPIDTIRATGATIINIHHGNEINPWINYPFIEWKKMKMYIDSAHQAGLKVKIYNTVRELSDHAYETFAMRSLNNEIYSPGKGGGYSWLQEHLDSNYIAAWFVPEWKDAAIINSGMNRWHNYYVEGMNWLVQNVGIDGIYLDDVAFDRITMKRIKRVLTKNGHPGIIDLHSANQYNKSDGFNNSANLYMEHFPYLNRLWFGEYFDYEKNDPDFFLTEVSGIPFGLMGEMLQDGGNAYRGMIYGMTNRMPWSDNADPRPIWKAWDDFGMAGTQMIGYWVDDNPVKIGNTDKVLATVYKKPGKTLISIASWENNDVDVDLVIDWKRLGIDPAKATITAPEIKNFQHTRTFKQGEKIPVEKGKGWLLVISN
ncbi:MAG: glycoside hydrolase domain-containing protein [Ginsengibacter sp.]